MKKSFWGKIRGELRVIYMNLQRRAKGKKRIDTNYTVRVLGRKKYDSFFGYYDISPFNKHDEIVYIEVGKEMKCAEIVLHSIRENNTRIVTSTRAWNWQQGARLRWFPGSDDIITFNDYKPGKYYNRILNLRTKEERIIDYPIYDYNNDGSLALTLDFARLGVLRPGYGYTCEDYKVGDLTSNGIGIIDVASGTLRHYITYSEIAKALNTKTLLENCYINHLSFSPSGKIFLFFWIEIVNKYHKASLAVYNIEKNEIIPLETKEKVSHYVWQDDSNIICTSYLTPRDCSYYIYNVEQRKRQIICPDILNRDGHPSIFKENIILTDTYPDLSYIQHLMLVDLKNDFSKPLLNIYSDPHTIGERRTDLHPRFNQCKDTICIDANVYGNRKLYLLKEFE